MNAPARFTLPDGFSFAGALEGAPLIPSRRTDGWTPDRQRTFLAAVAEGATVERAAAAVGLSPASAYALRQRAAGAAFALGWAAAALLQRQRLVDELHGRAFAGQVDTLTRADGTTVTRHRHDNRLGLALLARLDRIADADDRADRHGEAAAARLVAGEWHRYLDLVEADATPAQAGLFLAARATAAPAPAPRSRYARAVHAAPAPDHVDALAPVVALARADLYVRTGAGDAGELDVSDLDPARRADWTAEQWTRAEATGLIALAPGSQLSQHSPGRSGDDGGADAGGEGDDEPVWYDGQVQEWRTCFPLPPGGDADETGHWGDPDYERTLTEEEEELVEPARLIAQAVRNVEDGKERDAWFAARRAARAAAAAAEDARQSAEWPDDDPICWDIFDLPAADLPADLPPDLPADIAAVPASLPE